MISAGYASLLNPSIRERGSTMRAPVVEKANSAFLITEQHKIFTQDADELGWMFFGELLSHANRKPIPAQQLSSRRTGPHSREELVFFSGKHNLPPFEKTPAAV
jgi:hypothetical protein